MHAGISKETINNPTTALVPQTGYIPRLSSLDYGRWTGDDDKARRPLRRLSNYQARRSVPSPTSSVDTPGPSGNQVPMKNANTVVYNRKIAVLGFRAVGKTSLTNAFVSGTFTDSYVSRRTGRIDDD